jgi:alkanesulfonate monooxygenase SsuD/methylene tetrahydromethanopterin reductase-like flavin-dependent oxidoreductase (luciferase family)
MSPFELGIALPAGTGRGIVSFAQRAEARGFGSLVAVNHRERDALVTLAFAAAATWRIRLAAVGVPLPGRSAAVVARETRTLDELSGGRLTLGVTAEHDGVPPSLTRGDGRPFDAQLDALRAGPAAAVALLVGGADRRTIERVARAADGWLVPAAATLEDVATGRVALEDEWRRRGRSDEPRICAQLEVGEIADVAGRVAALRDVGATSVVLLPAAADVDHVDALADALSLVEPAAVA